MGATKKGAHKCTPTLSNYRATGESVTTKQRYKFFESLFSNLIIIDSQFYVCAINELQKSIEL